MPITIGSKPKALRPMKPKKSKRLKASGAKKPKSSKGESRGETLDKLLKGNL